MSPPAKPHVERPGPAEFRNPAVRSELRRATVWFGMGLAVAAVIILAQPLLLIFGGLVFAVVLDGGTRLLGRWLPIRRGFRLALVCLLGFGFIAWVFYFAGTTFMAQANELRAAVMEQGAKLYAWAYANGLVSESSPHAIGQQLLGSLGKLTSALGNVLGIVTSAFLIIVIGIFIASEPQLYDRGIAWMLPMRVRHTFYDIVDAVGASLRRLLFGRIIGMVVEGIFTWLALWVGGVPLSALLGLVTGVLAFIPNIGAIVSGLLMVAVGFSAGTNQGIWAIVTYFAVQNIDGYLILPYIARRTINLAPAVVLAAQLVLGALLGFLGLLLADSIVATIKVALQKWTEVREARELAGRPDAETAATG